MILEFTKRKNILNNLNLADTKIYFIVSIIFLIGIILGSIYFRLTINDIDTKQEIIDKFISLEKINNINDKDILIESLRKNIKLLIVFWIVGVSAIGAPFLLFFCLYKGFSIAFTISTVLINLSFIEGNIFVFKSMFLYTLITVFVIIVLTVSSLKVLINVFKNKKDIRLEIVRHSILSFLSAFLLAVSSILETILIVKVTI